MDVKPVLVKAVPEYRSLDSENADNYYRAGRRSAFIYNEVIDPFCSSLKESTGYSSENIPEGEKKIERVIGDFRFLIKVTPGVKRPGYKAVFDEAEQFLSTRLLEYDAVERPVGITTIEGEPYISAGDVLSMISEAKSGILSGDVKISVSETPELPENVSSMVVPLGMDMSELTPGNASRYLEGLSLRELYSGFISGFEGDLLSLSGYSNESPPEKTEHMYKALGSHIFHVKSIPYESTNWGKVLSGLDSEPPKRKPENGGDLVLIERGIEVPRLGIYKARTRRGMNMVRLNGILDRMESLKSKYTKTNVRQRPINHYPTV